MNNPKPQAKRRESGFWAAIAVLGLLVFVVRSFHHSGFDAETARNGMLARGLLDGLAASPWIYQYAPWAHGPLVFGVLLTPFFWLGGSKLLWSKALSAAFVIAGLTLWTATVRRAWGWAAAAMFALWCIFAPPIFEPLQHMSWANHSESILFSGLLLFVFQRFDREDPNFRSLFVLGALAGFASFFCYQNFVIAAAIAVGGLWRFGRQGVRHLAWPAAPAFVLGFSPHWLSRQKIYGDLVTDASLLRARALGRGWHLVKFFLHNIGANNSLLLSAALLALAAAGAVYSLRVTSRRDKEVGAWLGRVLGLFVVFYFVAAAFSERTLPPIGGSQYLATVYPALMALACLSVSRIPGFWKWAAIAPFLAIGVAHVLTPLPLDRLYYRIGWRHLTYFRGDDNEYLVYQKLPASWGDDSERALKSVAALPPSWKCDGLISVGRWIAPEKARELLARRPAVAIDGACFARGVGAQAARLLDASSAERPAAEQASAAILADLERTDRRWGLEFVAGFGEGLLARWNVVCREADFQGWLAKGAKPENEPPDVVRDTENLRRTPPSWLTGDYVGALARGMGRWAGASGRVSSVNVGPDAYSLWAGGRAVLAATIGEEPPPAALDLLRRGIAEGMAQRLKSFFHRYVLVPPSTLQPLIADALAAQRIGLRNLGGEPAVYQLEEIPSRAANTPDAVW